MDDRMPISRLAATAGFGLALGIASGSLAAEDVRKRAGYAAEVQKWRKSGVAPVKIPSFADWSDCGATPDYTASAVNFCRPEVDGGRRGGGGGQGSK